MYTDERIHICCRNAGIQNNNGIRKLMPIPNSSQIVLNDRYVDTHYYIQNQLNDKINYNSINLLSSY
jgi:hypothetical protein